MRTSLKMSPLDPGVNTTADVLTSMPTQMLEATIPGFSVLSRLLFVSLGIDISTVVSTCFVVVALGGAFNYAARAAWSLVGHWFMCSVSISSNDKLYEQVMHWVSGQNLAASSRSLRATTNKRQEELVNGTANAVGRGQQAPSNFYFAEIESSIPPEYTPAFGHHRFWSKGHFILFHREQEKQALDIYTRTPQPDRENLHLKCFGWSLNPIKQLLMEAKRLDAQQNKSTTTIRRSPQGPNTMWSYSSKRPSRSIETVLMDEKIKGELLEDIRDFLNPETHIFYASRGIPYRRGFLFYGPPGTGKTSTSFALAGMFGLELFTLSLREPFMSEHKLTQLFASLPTKCIVLLEDVDTAGIEKRSKQEIETSNSPDEKKQTRVRQQSQPFGNATVTTSGADGITLSGLLNAIDGVSSQEGRILIMTSNDPDSLDDALVRPGRVDRTVFFNYASKQHVKEVFLSMYSKGIQREGDIQKQSEKLENRTAKDDKDISFMASKFATVVPDLVFTPAEVQGFLLMHRKDPDKALADVTRWRDELLAAKKNGRNVVDTSISEKDSELQQTASVGDQPEGV